MKDLIEALTILAKYMPVDKYAPTHCEHDVLMVVGIEKGVVSPEDATRLDALGFFFSDEDDCWITFRFGSC
jgi:hypothetical protein